MTNLFNFGNFSNSEWVSHSIIHYSNFRDIHTNSAHPILKRIYSILETFQTTSEQTMHYSNFRNIHTDSAQPMLWRIYSILVTFQITSEFPILIFFILILDTFIQIVRIHAMTNLFNLGNFSNKSEFPILIFFILILETFMRIVYIPCYDESIQFWKHFHMAFIQNSYSVSLYRSTSILFLMSAILVSKRAVYPSPFSNSLRRKLIECMVWSILRERYFMWWLLI